MTSGTRTERRPVANKHSQCSAAPAPAIDVATSLGGGGVSVLTIIALIIGALGLLAGGFALMSGGSQERSLA